MKLHEYITTAIPLPWLYLKSLYKGYQHRALLDSAETYCMFIGYERSGHSLIGALLNAHPDIVMAHELGVLKYILAGFSKRQIYSLILENSVTFAKEGSVSDGRYSYKVPNQWQGKFRKMKIIGDKEGPGVTRRLMARPWLLPRLQKTINGKIKMFHVVRNPYDNISTMAKRLDVGLEKSIRFYFSMCKTIADVKKKINTADLFELRHEAFIDNSREHLRQMCVFVGVDPSDDYLNDCSGIVYKSPNKTRHDAAWNDDLIAIVEEKITRFPFLEGYSYTD